MHEAKLKNQLLTLEAEAKRHLFHMITVVSMYCTILLFTFLSSHYHPNPSSCLSSFYSNGPNINRIIIFSRCAILLPLPLAVANFFGILMFNTSSVPSLESSAVVSPLVNFRFLTFGNCIESIKHTLERNMKICNSIGLQNYVFEIVTTKPLNLVKDIKTKELVVPHTYRTNFGSLYRARLLQFSLEQSNKTDHEWSVNLTDETILTETALIGILNFVKKGDYQIGQGTVCYNRHISGNWKMTLADFIRVGFDYGMLRMSLEIFKKPIFGWKDNFIVTSAKAEQEVTYDFGPTGSIAESYIFAMIGWSKGYKFGFVEGVARDRSHFSKSEFFRQRRDWMYGFVNTLMNSTIALECKIATFFSLFGTLSLPFGVLSIILGPIYPLQVPVIFRGACGFVGGMMIFLYIFGAMKTFSVKRYGNLKRIILCWISIIYLPITVCLEIWSTLISLFSLGIMLVKMVRNDKGIRKV